MFISNITSEEVDQAVILLTSLHILHTSAHICTHCVSILLVPLYVCYHIASFKISIPFYSCVVMLRWLFQSVLSVMIVD